MVAEASPCLKCSLWAPGLDIGRRLPHGVAFEVLVQLLLEDLEDGVIAD